MTLIKVFHFKILFQLTPLVFLCNVCPLVIELFAPRQANLYLYQAPFKVNLQRDQGIPFFRNFSIELHDFILMKQKASGAQRIFIKNISLFIRADVHSVNVHLPFINFYKGFLYTALAHTDGFYLRTEKFNSSLQLLINKIIVICLFIIGYELNTILRNTKTPFFQLLSIIQQPFRQRK